MSTKAGLAVLVALLVIAPTGCSGTPATSATRHRPNIVFIFADDHACRAVGAYGAGINETPNIDRIASEGMRFDRCLATNAICAPSRATVLTGQYGHRNGIMRNGPSFDGSQMTFPKLLRRAGYETAMIGKWHLKSDPTGFDHWSILLGQGPYFNPPMKVNGERREHEGYTTDVITDQALAWLREDRDRDKPFLLMLQHKAPHRSWQPAPRHLALYDGEQVPEPATLFDDYATRGTPARTQDMTIAKTLTPYDLKMEPPRNLTDAQRAAWHGAYDPKNDALRAAGPTGDELVRWKYQRYLKDYLRAITGVDENVGRVLDELEHAGLANDTVVVYASDQGFFLGEHGWFDKRFMYEPSLRLPLLVRWPGVTREGASCGAITSNLDFAETFLEIAGADVPVEMQGRSLVPLLRGEMPGDWRTSFYYHYTEFPAVHSVHKHDGVCDQRYKLIRFYEIDEWELYDLANDPEEVHNLHGEPDLAPVVARLTAELTRLRAHHGVPAEAGPVGQR